jgi:hypothetical protein
VNKANDQATLDTLARLGVKPAPIDIPDFPVSVTAHDVEMAVFFDELVRSGRVKLMTNQTRSVGFRASRLVPAVEYLQSQRARMMMMMELAKATQNVDVFLIPRGGGGGGGGRGPVKKTPRRQLVAAAVAEQADVVAVATTRGPSTRASNATSPLIRQSPFRTDSPNRGRRPASLSSPDPSAKRSCSPSPRRTRMRQGIT